MFSFLKLVFKGYFPIPLSSKTSLQFSWRHLSQTWILFMSVIWSILKILEHHYWVRNVLEAFSHSPVHLFLPHHLMIESYKEYVEISNAWWSTSSNKNCCPLTIIASSIANWVLIMQFGLKSKWPCVIEQLFGSWTFFC